MAKFHVLQFNYKTVITLSRIKRINKTCNNCNRDECFNYVQSRYKYKH